ncbi:hypothetical protein GF361_05760 [Candidatus Woesearchaeota archaeon]|nr:hypothetical protein [Candidatus Woesearchaeota archaeon]
MAKTFEEHVKSKRNRGRSKKNRRNSRRGRGNKNRRDLKMTQVICDECGKDCEVPFKPSSDKPVYCSDCFEKHDPKNKGGSSGKDIEKINKKIDKIMKALKIN